MAPNNGQMVLATKATISLIEQQVTANFTMQTVIFMKESG